MNTSQKSNWFVYIVCCADNTFYTGITTNLEKRILTHNQGVGAKYTKMRLPVKLIYSESQTNRSSASIREAEIKKLTKKQKEILIKTSSKSQ